MAYDVCKKENNEKSKQLLKAGQVPCIIYGDSLDDNISIKMSKSSLIKLMNSNTKGSMIPLNLEGKIINCVVKELQKSFEGKVIHVDFQAIAKDEILKLKIPVNYIGEEVLESKKLVLEALTSELELQGTIDNMPENIQINVSDMNFEDRIMAKDIELPKGVKLVTDSDTLIAIANGFDNASEDEETAK